MFMKSILGFVNEEDRRMLDDAFSSVKSLPYYTYFIDNESRKAMPYSMGVLQGIADTAIILFHVILALDLKNQGFPNDCPPAGFHRTVFSPRQNLRNSEPNVMDGDRITRSFI